VSDEQPVSGGAAFWAARGVRIEPEIADAEDVEDTDATDSTDSTDEQQPSVAESSVDEAVVEEAVVEEVVVEPEAEPEPEADPALPAFPQQRSSAAPAPAAAASTAPPASPASPASSTEPAWQLTGGDLATLPPLKTCIEAILMVVDEPTPVVTLAQVLERPTAAVAEALVELAEEYTVLGRGFELREVGIAGDGSRTGWRVYSRVECAPVVERFVRDGQQAKLTQAALETLAVVAYRQPVSRSKVSAIRGVNCDGVMRTLLARGLVEEYGNDLETGAVLYQTTGYFLERMALKSLDELPDLAPLLPSAAEADVEDFA
jgi:segregation and condensation protein B